MQIPDEGFAVGMRLRLHLTDWKFQSSVSNFEGQHFQKVLSGKLFSFSHLISVHTSETTLPVCSHGYTLPLGFHGLFCNQSGSLIPTSGLHLLLANKSLPCGFGYFPSFTCLARAVTISPVTSYPWKLIMSFNGLTLIQNTIFDRSTHSSEICCGKIIG